MNLETLSESQQVRVKSAMDAVPFAKLLDFKWTQLS